MGYLKSCERNKSNLKFCKKISNLREGERGVLLFGYRKTPYLNGIELQKQIRSFSRNIFKRVLLETEDLRDKKLNRRKSYSIRRRFSYKAYVKYSHIETLIQQKLEEVWRRKIEVRRERQARAELNKTLLFYRFWLLKK